VGGAFSCAGSCAGGPNGRLRRSGDRLEGGGDGVPSDVLADLSALRGDCSPPARLGADGHALAFARLEGELAGLREALAEARLRASAADALASEERTRADRAIAAFVQLAERLEAMAAQHAIKPWWQRLLQRAG
jgi:hypothetical protein